MKSFMLNFLGHFFETTWTPTLDGNTISTRWVVFKHFYNCGTLLANEIAQTTPTHKRQVRLLCLKIMFYIQELSCQSIIIL